MPSTVLNNFVTIRKTRGDILKPAEFRSFVEMIRGVSDKYDFTMLIADYKLFMAHVVNYNDPHHDDKFNFLPQIIQETYNIYVNMLPSPLSMDDFTAQIVPSLDFLELIRRIVLNHYLYEQVKLADGSVPATAQAILSDDWGITGANPAPVTLSFGGVLADETAFIKLGWGTNTTPFPTIFTALSLQTDTTNLPVIFETNSTTPYLSFSTPGAPYPITLPTASNDLTTEMWVINAPQTATTLLTLRNSNDTLILSMDATKAVTVTYNGAVALQSGGVSLDGKIRIVMTRQGFLALTINQNGVASTKTTTIADLDGPFTMATIGVATEDLFGSGFALRSLTFYQGYNTPLPA